MHSFLKEADELSMLSDDILQYVENMKRLHRKIYNQKIFCSILGHKVNRYHSVAFHFLLLCATIHSAEKQTQSFMHGRQAKNQVSYSPSRHDENVQILFSSIIKCTESYFYT